VDASGAPDGIAIIGIDAAGELVQNHFDSRGVSRVHGMSLEDGATVTGAWEIALDGSTWEHDFDLVCTKAGAPPA
jgi:hypothetical protein